MSKHGVLSRVEMESRSEIQYETYIKTINIEGLTMAEMAKRQILPAVISFKAFLADSINSILDAEGNADVEKALLTKISKSFVSFSGNLEKLEKAIQKAAGLHGDSKAQAIAYRDLVVTAMSKVRQDADALETMVDADYWPMPTYSQLLFNV
jgi:glutamine synthetase